MYMCGSVGCVPWFSPLQGSSPIKVRTRVLGLVGKHLYLPSQLMGPGFSF